MALTPIIKKSKVSDELKKVASQLVLNMDGHVLRSQEVVDIFWLCDSINVDVPPSHDTLKKYPSLQRFLSKRQVKIDYTDTLIQLDHLLVFLSYIRKSLASRRNENARLQAEVNNKVNASFLGKDIHTTYELSLIDDMKRKEFATTYEAKYSSSLLSEKCKYIVNSLKLGESCEDQIIEYVAILSRLHPEERDKWIEKVFPSKESKEIIMMMWMNGVWEEISFENLYNLLTSLNLWTGKHSFPAPVAPKKSKKENN